MFFDRDLSVRVGFHVQRGVVLAPLLPLQHVVRTQVVLVQKCLRPSSRVEDEEHTSEEIKQLVARIQQ